MMKWSFDAFTMVSSRFLAHPFVLVLAFASVVLWAGCGPVFDYSQQWQLVINTGTTIITFLMAFVILSSSACEEAAMQVKLDELIRVTGARNDLIAVELRTGAEIEAEAKRLRRGVGQRSLTHD